MKEQYQKEISQIHVPADLLEKTKLAMQEEQAKKNLPKSGKVISFKKLSIIAAAAVVLLLVVPSASNMLRDDAQEEQKIQMYLSGREEAAIQAIEPEKSWIEEIVDAIKNLFD